MKTFAIAILSVLLLSACQKDATVREYADSGFMQLQGATVVLKQPLTVPAGKARVFVQDGKPVGHSANLFRGSFDYYKPHCGFEIQSVAHDGVVIQPAIFRITRVQSSIVPVVMREPVQVAGLQLASGLDGPGSGAFHEGYHFWLVSEDEPEVMRMSCYAIYLEPPDLRPPTLQEIQQTLGAIAEIRY